MASYALVTSRGTQTEVTDANREENWEQESEASWKGGQRRTTN